MTGYINRIKTRQCLLTTFNKMRIGKKIGKHDRLQMCAIFWRFGRSKDNCVIISYNSRSLKLYKKFAHVLKLCNWYIGIMWRLIFFTFFQTVEINIYLGSLLFYQQNYWKRVNKFWNQFFQFLTRWRLHTC